jgi:predicted ATP-grasp superfamily ATP-dependent carboligase
MLKILIVGVSVRAIVDSAVHSGYPIVALDAFGDLDLRARAESYSLHHDFHTPYSSSALYASSRNLSFDALSYTSNLENHAETLSSFAAKHKIIGNSPEVIKAVRCWANLFANLERAGFSVPKTIFSWDKEKVDYGRRWLIKPTLSGGGQGIAWLQTERFPSDSFMLQEYIPGKSCSASFVANGRESVLIGVAEQLVGVSQFGSQGFRYCGNILPFPEVLDHDTGTTILEKVRNLTTFLTREYCLTGVNGIDFIISDNRIYLTEVNPRYSASMELIEQAYGLPVFHLHVQAVLEGRLPKLELEPLLKSGQFYGKGILYAENDVTVPDTQGWQARCIRDVPATGEKIPMGGPVCTIFADCPNYSLTIGELISRAGILREEIYGQAEFNFDNRTLYQTRHRNLNREGEL